MNKPIKCYVCYENLDTDNHTHYHPHCLTYLFNIEIPPEITFDEQNINALAKEYVNKKMGIPGVQRKLSISLDKSKHGSDNSSRLTIVGYLNGNYILKPPTPEYPYMPEIEDLTMQLADLANLRVAPHGLIKLKNNQLAYITKRFDRMGKQKIAVEDLCQLSLKRTDEKYKSSSERAAKVIRYYSSTPGHDCLVFFELLFFSFLVGNADMHLKNFSFLTQEINNVHFSPCYDLLSTRLLIPEHEDSEEVALAINGKKSNLRKKDFLAFGKSMDIPDKVLMQSMSKMIDCWPIWEQKIKKSFIPFELQEKLSSLIQARINQSL